MGAAVCPAHVALLPSRLHPWTSMPRWSLRSHGGCPGGSPLTFLPLPGRQHPPGRCVALVEGRRGWTEAGGCAGSRVGEAEPARR